MRGLNMSGRYPLNFNPSWTPKSESYFAYADVYKDAITSLLKDFSKKPPIHDYSLAPVLFLLRQYIELQLKGIIFFGKLPSKAEKRHDIIFLYSEALNWVREKYGTERLGDPHPDVVRFINSLGKFDAKGEAFRYPETVEGEAFAEKIEKMDSWLYDRITTVNSLSDVAGKIFDNLEGIEGYMDIMSENEQEGWANQ